MINLLFFIIIIFIVSAYYWFNSYRKQKNPLFEQFQAEKANKELYLKPFSVTCDKNKIYDALLSFQDQIDELEFTMKTGGKKYDKMYEWYMQKIKRDSAEASKANEELAKKLKSDMDKKLANVTSDFEKENKSKYEKENAKDLKDENFNVNDLLSKAFETGDSDQKIEVAQAVEDL
jgi:type II secretory ATPase GspE/PulE/Tfp pilus assembly ATPase PilB-like protein